MTKTAQTIVNLLLTAALTTSTLVLATAGAYAKAEEVNDQALTLAAADTGAKTAWVETQKDVEARIAEDLNQKTALLSEKADAKLNAQLEAKLAKTFEI
jgi:hypothetical protein